MLAAVLLSLVYVLLFPVPTRPELTVVRHYVTDAASAGLVAASGTTVPLVLEDLVAYLDDEGRLTHRAASGFATAAVPWGYVTFGRTPDQLVVQAPDGSFLTSLSRPGYPTVWDDGVLVTGPDDMSLTMYSRTGELRWEGALQAPAIALARGGGYTIAGMMAGGIVAFDESGNTLEGSAFVTGPELAGLGVAVHPQTNSVAALVDDGRQVLVVSQIVESSMIPVLRRELGPAPSGPAPLGFTPDGRYVIVPHDGIVIVNAETGAMEGLESQYDVRRIEADQPGLVVTLGTSDESDPARGFRFPSEVIHFDVSGITPVRQYFWSTRADLVTDGDRVYLVDGDRVLSYSVVLE